MGWIYFELMAEMRAPKDFPKVFIINAPLQIGLNLAVACVAYHFTGDQAKGYFLDNIGAGPLYGLASGLLFAHVAVAYMLKHVVLARYLHGIVAPRGVTEETCKARLQHTACGVVLIATSYLLANAIPF